MLRPLSLAAALLLLASSGASAAPASAASTELPMKAAKAKAAPVQAAASDALPEGRSLLRSFIEASGGVAGLADIQNALVQSTFSIPAQSMEGRIVIAFARPDLIRSTADMTGIGKIEQGYDGATGWSVDPMSGPRILGAGELKQLQNSEANVFKLQDFDKLYEVAETKGLVTFAGAQAWEVRLVADGRESTAYFDPTTKLMTGMKTTVASMIGDVPAEITLSDYRTFGKLKLPTKSTQMLLGGVIEARSTIESVEFNVPAGKLPSFAPPAEITALTGAGASAGE